MPLYGIVGIYLRRSIELTNQDSQRIRQRAGSHLGKDSRTFAQTADGQMQSTEVRICYKRRRSIVFIGNTSLQDLGYHQNDQDQTVCTFLCTRWIGVYSDGFTSFVSGISLINDRLLSANGTHRIFLWESKRFLRVNEEDWWRINVYSWCFDNAFLKLKDFDVKRQVL